MDDKWRIDSPKQLAEILGQPRSGGADKVSDRLDPACKDFIKHSPLALVSTVDAAGRLDISPKGDAPGFCRIADDKTLLLPDRKGNRLTFGFHNILETERISLLFVIPRVRETLRVNGSAAITRDPELLEQLSVRGKPALLCTQIHIDECFLHCGKAMIRSQIWQPELWQEPPDVSFGRQMRDKALRNGSPIPDAEKGKDFAKDLNDLVEQSYRDELY